jgi:hypothetical protein
VSSTAIVNSVCLVGPDLQALPDSVVIFKEESIAAVGPRAEVPIPTGATVVDGRGLTLFPGFIDAHVHIGFYEPNEVLCGGVTSVRDLGWPPERIWPLVSRSANPSFKGPTIVAAGPILTAAGGYPTRAAWAPTGTGLGSPTSAPRARQSCAPPTRGRT